jgi:hypothetical protein
MWSNNAKNNAGVSVVIIGFGNHSNKTKYIYDGEKINGRYRITNSKSNVGRKPMINYVTGWINKK